MRQTCAGHSCKMTMEEVSSNDLEAPLLPEGEDGPTLALLDEPEPETPPHGRCSDVGGVCNLAVTAVGAGMLALPKALASVSIVLGAALFGAVCLLTYFSSSIIIRWAWKLKKRSYGDVILAEFGPTGAKILQGSIIVHVSGVMIVYCIIIADMLVGSPPLYHGILPTMLHRHDGVWYLTRAFVVGVLIVCVVLPMLISRDLTVVARYSRLSVFMMLMLAGTIATLAGVAVLEGKAAPVRLLPDTSVMGDGSPFDVVTDVLTVISVACLAWTLQFNLLPVHHSLKNPALPNMLRITKQAIALCAALYFTIALSGYVLFGDATEGDVLKNLTINYVATLVNKHLATWLINGITICNTFNLLVNFVLKVWAVRDCVSDLALGKPAATLPQWEFYSLTLLLVAGAYLTSVFIPSVWLLVSLVGSTACVTFSYIFPGLLVIRRESGLAMRTFAYGSVSLAVIMAALAVFNTAMGNRDM